MLSLAEAGSTDRSHTLSKIAEFMDAQDSDVTYLLQEGRLGGALLSTLRKKGVAPTPAVKNSVQRLVRTLEAAPGPLRTLRQLVCRTRPRLP